MKPAIAALALLIAGTAWGGAGDLHLQPCTDKKVKQPSKCGTLASRQQRPSASTSPGMATPTASGFGARASAALAIASSTSLGVEP